MEVVSLQRRSAVKQHFSFMSFISQWNCFLTKLDHVMMWTLNCISTLFPSPPPPLKFAQRSPWVDFRSLKFKFRNLNLLKKDTFFVTDNIVHRVQSPAISCGCWRHWQSFSPVTWVHPKWQSGATLAATITSPPLFCTTAQSAFLWIIQRDWGERDMDMGHGY